ncbi:hypothetical protein PRIPAC_71829 [Pristionchus pacificus]|uniref:Uncharacterized protein n=1 Tax=Pristionchus pacificus TaxID=54126 RepID=A0A2A6C5J9_PRIPA|nr:hypothetical protein PRIPAC_71829 [Pristionchus pacificus]|eukprot:PDM73419.1 hypothetical protein PRIPAC_40775 [Pristionchus pacificus]
MYHLPLPFGCTPCLPIADEMMQDEGRKAQEAIYSNFLALQTQYDTMLQLELEKHVWQVKANNFEATITR